MGFSLSFNWNVSNDGEGGVVREVSGGFSVHNRWEEIGGGRRERGVHG